jgi:hypothetical protein
MNRTTGGYLHLEYEVKANDYAIPLHSNSELCRSIAIKWLTKMHHRAHKM